MQRTLEVQYWLNPSVPTEVTLHQSLPQIFCDQNAIGWDLLPRGFLSTAWRKLYVESASANPLTFASRPTHFLSGLVRRMWSSQLKYWQDFTEATHNTNGADTWVASEKRREYQERIRILHQKRSECLHAHRDHYFYDDVAAFLDQATIPQMKMYLHHYSPAISQSIQDAKKSQTRQIFMFPGFSHKPSRRQTPAPPKQTSPSNLINSFTKPGKQGVQILRKHTRWRNLAPSTKSIRDYFTKTSAS